MFKYERAALRTGFRKLAGYVTVSSRAAWKGTEALSDFVNRQVTDPAVRRAIVLAFTAYLIRHLPFLDQDTAEKLGDEAMVLFGIMLSKMRGTAELRAQSQAHNVQGEQA